MNVMKCTKIASKIQSDLVQLIDQYPLVHPIVQAVHAAGGRTLLVGGAVRDLLLGKLTKDLDIEVHGIMLEQLESILSQFGPVDLVGKSFGVLRLHNVDIDWSVPRADSAGRKPLVHIDESMSIKKAFERRDLTINAMGIDLVTFELIDPFGGAADLQAHRLCAPNLELFAQDPLRFFRVMQFIGRFEMEPDEALNQCCARMSLVDVSRERIAVEFEKLLLQSKEPSRGIRWLAQIRRLADVLPELYETIGVEQDPGWHPEGDVFEHTMQALDASVRITYDNEYEMLVLRYAALCHDLGKATTTKIIDGRWRSLGHEKESAVLSKRMLKRIVMKFDLIDDVSLLAAHHMAPGQFIKLNAGLAAYKRLALKLMPRMNLHILADLACADKQGRNPHSREPLRALPDFFEPFLAQARKAQVEFFPEKPVLEGRDLIGIIPPGPALGELLKRAYTIQIEEGITDKLVLKERVLAQPLKR